MIIKKQSYTNIRINTTKLNIKQMIENKEPFSDLIYKIKEENKVSYFILLEHKEVEIEKNSEETEPTVEDLPEKDEVGLKRGFNIKKPEPSKEFQKINNKDKPKTKWNVVATSLIEFEGIIYHLHENKYSNIDKQTINLLSIKKPFKKEELIKNKFKIKKLDKKTSEQRFKFTEPKQLLNPEIIEVSLEEIYENKKYFPITKIELNPENEYELQLAHSKNLRYKKLNQNENNLTEIIEEYQSENNYKRFSRFFEVI
ncbi:MAG TPA: hypothetical protein VK121_08775 [Pseudogracilibacillus sp.]|nr:hypothetical protein [Pseudogracilibacillus sp.]